MDDELIVGVPRDRIIDEDWHGILASGLDPLLARIEAGAESRPRSEAESDPDWKQIIPYLLLRDDDRIFLMRRTRAGGDERLHERWSIGIGGHLAPTDGGIAGGLQREFAEEMAADWRPEPELIGLLNDDSTPVGQVHLGVVFWADARGREIAVRETHKLTGAFATLDEVRRGYDHLETWSQILLDHVVGNTDRQT